MWNPLARFFTPPPAPHETVRIDPKHFEALATAESVAGDPQAAPDEYRTKSRRAHEILTNLHAKDGVTIQTLNGVSDFWRGYDAKNSDEVAIRDLGIELPEAMVAIVTAQLTASAHSLDESEVKKR